MTVGKPEVIINGESRPLDVPPMIYQGTVLVPVRVISEGMGAYVQWVPDQRVSSSCGTFRRRRRRRRPPPPPPPPPPTPTPPPIATPYQRHLRRRRLHHLAEGLQRVQPGQHRHEFVSRSAAVEFNALNIPWMVEGSFEQFGYPHNCGYAVTSQHPIRSVSSRRSAARADVRPGVPARATRTSTPALGLRVSTRASTSASDISGVRRTTVIRT